MSNCSDPCADVNCGPGTCDDGTCICPTGYEGISCETESRSLFYGSYNVTMSDCGPSVTLGIESIQIEERTGDILSVSVLLIEEGQPSITLDGTISGNRLDSSGESNGFDLITRGTFSETGDTLTGEIVVVGSSTCDATFVK